MNLALTASVVYGMNVYTKLIAFAALALALSGCCRLDPSGQCEPEAEGPPHGCVPMSADREDRCSEFCAAQGEQDSCLYDARECFCGECCE